MNRYKAEYTWTIDILFLLFFLGGLAFFCLGNRPLFVPDEGRYAEIAREMFVNHNYITPYLNGIKYFEKPTLFYWLAAFAIKIGGLNLWAIRSVNAIISLIGCLATYATARQLFDRQTGLLAALILGTNLLYFTMSRMISLDLPVTIFLALSLYAFLLATHQPTGSKRRNFLWFAAIMAALAVLTKGLIGIVFPVLIIGIWLLVLNRWYFLKQASFLSCLLIFLCIAAPWHILVSLHNPEFPYLYFIEQHFLRYSTPNVGHYQPAWFFIPCLLLGFFPWICFLPQAIFKFISIKFRERNATELFFIIWAFCIFTFFSFSKSKLIPYILPIFPPLAILVARYLMLMVNEHKKLGVSLGYIFLILFNLILIVFFFRQQSALPPEAQLLLLIGTCILLLGSLLALFGYDRLQEKSHWLTVIATWIFLLLLAAAMPTLDTRTILPLAKTLQPILQPENEVITYNQYYQDLPFYLERRVSILNWRNELTHGMQYQDTSTWMLNDKQFWERWHSQKRIYVFISRSEFEKLQQTHPTEKFYIVDATDNTAVISNSPHIEKDERIK